MRVNFCGNTKVNTLYFSDVHGSLKNIGSFKTAVDEFDEQNKDELTLKLAGGDINLDKALKPNMLMLKIMDLIGLDASSIGNHDLEGGDYWAKAIDAVKPKFKFLSSNFKFTKKNPVQKNLAKSTIIDRKGEKIGVIGVASLEAMDLMFSAPFNNYVEVLPFDEAVETVKEEVKKLESQGIDKIFLLAHTGKTSKEGMEYYEKLAEIGGIDVIIGGHDHKEYDLWYESDRGEPVKIVSVGKSPDKNITGEGLDSFGVLETVFDDNGVLIKDECKNEVKLTGDYLPSKEIANLEEKYLKSNKIISSTLDDISCKNRKIEENPVGDLCADAMLWMVNKETKGKKAQIAFVNSGTIRDDIPAGDIKIKTVRQALPFVVSTLIKTDLTKKQIIEALEWGAESTAFSKPDPGLVQVGGLNYTIDSNLKVKDVYLINEDGSEGQKLDDMPDDTPISIVYDAFLMTGVAGFTSLKKDPNDKSIEYFPYARQDALIEYLSENFSDKPVTFTKNRIKIEKEAPIEPALA